MRSLLFLLVTLSCACGDDAAPADAGQMDSGTDVLVDVPPDTPLVDAGAADVPVDAGAAQTVTIRAVGGATPETPIAGLAVYAGAGEALMVATTNADGEATLDVTPGTAITVEFVGMEQTTYTSLVSFDENVPQIDGVFILPILVPVADLDLDIVTLSGTVTNTPAEVVAWVVSADVRRGGTTTPSNSPDFTIEVPRQDGDITVYLGTGLAPSDPRPSPRGFDRMFGPGASITVDASMDQSDLVIDAVDDAGEFEAISGSFAVPEGDAFFGTAPATIDIRTVDGAIIGGVARIFFDDEASLFRWDGIRFLGDAVATVSLQQGPRLSYVVLDTDATGDLGELPFLPPPNVSAPGFGETVSLGGEVVLDNTPANTYLSLFLVNGDSTKWWVISGNESVVTIPALPADSTVLVGDNVRFRPRYCTRQTTSSCTEYSLGPAVEAAP